MSFYAWWSQKQFETGGSVVYRRADGQDVEVTQVTQGEEHGTAWDDIVYLGVVEDFVSSNKFDLWPSFDWDEEIWDDLAMQREDDDD